MNKIEGAAHEELREKESGKRTRRGQEETSHKQVICH